VTDTIELELEPQKLIAGGEALARHADGRAVMVSGALPGERVRARVVVEKRDYLRAQTIAVLQAAPERRIPPCPALARGCGGCDWQHIEPAAQLPFKVTIVTEALRRTARIEDVAVRMGASVPDTAYRTTLRLAVDPQGMPGFRAAGSQRSVPIEACLVAHPALNELLDDLRLPGAREVLLRVGARTGERLMRWWPDTLPVPGNIPAGVRTGPHGHVEERVAGVSLRVGADSFFQSSPEAAELLIDAVRRAAGGPDEWGPEPVLDAFGGVGLFSATLVPTDRECLVVESNASACEDARLNLAGRIARVVERTLERWTPKRAGLVIANPARAGLGKPAAAVLAATRAPVLVLVSCDPVAFARDARLLAEQGYQLEGCEVLDLFPQTHHMEVVSRFVRKGQENL
jgi:23S rRNA (uracil1939-C5)-methyltransferase